MTHVAITGSTGRVGGAVARLLSDAHIPTRLVVRDADRAPDLPHTEVVQAEYGHIPRMVAALRGIDTVLMVPIHDGSDMIVPHHDFIDSAVNAGVRQVVYLSFVGAAEDATAFLARHHGNTEAYLRDSGLEHTIVRSNYFAETLARFIRGDEFRSPVGDGRLSAVARADVAAALAAVLQDPRSHSGHLYELTGPHAHDFDEIAAVFTQAHGEPYRFVDESEDEALASRADYRAPEVELVAWLSVYRAIRHGVHEHVTDDVRHLTGRDPISMAEALSRPDD